MLHFTFGSAATFYLTLSELASIGNGVYLFVFNRRVPGKTLAIVLSPETSNERSDEFIIDVDALFDGYDLGQYTYEVYEQENVNNTDPAQAGALLERGIMHLHPQTPFTYTAYEPATIFNQPA